MPKQIIPNRVLDITRHTDDEAAHKKPENALANGESSNHCSVGRQFLTRDGLVQAVNDITHNERGGEKKKVRKYNTNKPCGQAPRMLTQVGKEPVQAMPFLRVKH